MQRTLIQKEDSLRTTPEVKNKLKVIKENSHLFNCIDKIAADHDVYVTNTMIKVTYKKALKDQNASENSVDSTGGTVFAKSLNQANKKKAKPMETMSLSNNDISFITKSPKVVGTEGSKAFAYHSTPKPQSLTTDKKNKYVNGLNLTGKPTNPDDKTHSIKIKKNSSSSDGGNNVKKSKSNSIKPPAEVEVSKRFLKGNNSVVKPKNKVIQRNSADGRKVTVNKAPSKKVVKLDNDIKKKVDLDKKGLKRKLSNSDLNVINKKMKISENKSKKLESRGRDSESYKMKSGKKPIMSVDPDLPPGWTRYIRTRNKGAPNEQYIVYIINPQGKKFQYKWKLRKYLEKTNSSLDVDQFFFGLYQRPKSTNTCSSDKDEQKKSDNSEKKSRGRTEHSRKSSESVDSKQEEGSSYETSKSSEGKELLLFDPDLPFGWKRIIHSNSNGKKQVHIISPDGKIFRRRYRLHEYLKRHQYSHYLNRFYFGLYPKKDGGENSERESEEKSSPGAQSNNNKNKKSINMKSDKGKGKGREKEKGKEKEKKINETKKRERLLGKKQLRLILRKIDESGAYKQSDLMQTGDKCVIINAENEKKYIEFKDKSPMYYDPNLPKGWKRLIKMRSYGESAGRLEVVIVSPDGRKHRSKKNLEHYLSQNNFTLKAEDFDFHVFGKPRLKKRSESAEILEPEQKPENKSHCEPDDVSLSTSKKKFDRPVPELDIDSLKEVEISPEGRLINKANGLMISVGLSSARNERRQRLSRGEQENQLKTFLSSNEEALPSDGCDIPTKWIQTLIKCRGDFRTLEPDAVSTLGEAARDFIQKLSFLAFSNSEKPDKGLRYEDVADTVHRLDSLSPLQTLIPKKITYKEYIKLNRPKQFLSFT